MKILYFYIISIDIIVLVHSFVLKFETSCNSSEFVDLENLIGSLHRYTPNDFILDVRDMGLTAGQRKLLKLYQNIEVISPAQKQKENATIINVKNEFFLKNKTLYYHSTNGKHNYIDSIRKRFYLAVVIPFIQSQFINLINQLNLEKNYIPCRNKLYPVDLIFYHNEKSSSILDHQVRQLNYHHSCFKNIRVFAGDLSEKENPYPIGSAIMWKKLFINEQFNNISLRYHGYTHFFLMEPDTRPIRSYWLDAVIEQIIHGHDREAYISTQWWMTGSVYRGFQSIGQYFFHINGNALYHLSSSFIRFIEAFSRDCLLESQRLFGYDLGLFIYLFKNVDEGKKFWHKFQFSDFIQNCWHTSCNETNIEFLYENPNTYLIHGNKIETTTVKPPASASNRNLLFIALILFLLIILRRYRYIFVKLFFKFNFFYVYFLNKKSGQR